MNPLREFARGGLIGLTGSIVAAAAGLVLTVVVARTLGPAGAGVFFVVVAAVTILTEVTELGADTALVRLMPRYRELGRTADLRRMAGIALAPVLVAGALAAAGMYTLAPWIAGTFAAGSPDAVVFVQIAAPFLAVAAARNVALAGARGMGDLVAYSLIGNVAMPLARPLLIMLAAALGWGSGAVMLAWSLPGGLACLLAAAVLWRLLPRRGGRTGPRTGVAGEFWAFSGPRGVAAVLEVAIVWVGVPIVSAALSTHDAGVYATAGRFITSGTLVLAATRIAIAPQISALLTRGDREEAERLNGVATGWVVAASWPLYLALAVFGPFVLTLFGEDFSGGAVPLAVLALSMLPVLAAGNVQTVLLMGGKSSWSLANKAVALAVCVVAHLVLVPGFGVVGAAVAWALTMLTDTVLAALQVRLLLGLRLGLGPGALTGLWALAWFGVLGVALRALLGTGPAAFALYLVVACAGYALVLWRYRDRLHLDVLVSARRNR